MFTDALEAEGLMDELLARADGLIPVDDDDERRPILLAVFDNGPQMTSGSTREFRAMVAMLWSRSLSISGDRTRRPARPGCATRRTVVSPVQPG
ncbi:MAG: hypothetical protein ACRDZO_15975 [Egibacteraceae bacterium]